MPSASHIKVKNTTGRAASDLHITFKGTGGSLEIDRSSVRPRDGGNAPKVPSNDIPTTNEGVIEWSTPVVGPDESVEFDAATAFGPLQFDSGFWTGPTDKGARENIGSVKEKDIEIKQKGKRPGGNIPDELLLPEGEDPTLTQASLADEDRGRRILGVLVAVAAAINLAIFGYFFGRPLEARGSFAGVVLSVAVLIGVILLAKWWEKKKKKEEEAPPVENVEKIDDEVGTNCKPENATRIAREQGDPAFSDWTVARTWTQKSVVAKAKKYVPSTDFLTYAFAELNRTAYYQCQKQACKNGKWANVGARYDCNEPQTKTVQVYGGPNKTAALQGWDDKSIRQSIGSGYYE